MIERYSRPGMAAVWSEEHRLGCWLAVELALVEALAERGEVPAEAAAALRSRARIAPARMREIDSVQSAMSRPRRIRSSRTNAPLMRVVSAASRWLIVQPTISPR